METAVNRLLLGERAEELMRMSVDEALASLRSLTAQLPRQSDRTMEQTEFQQFSTPPALAFIAAKRLGAKPADVALEPSAGTGSLAIWPRSIGARVICNEINNRRRALLIIGQEGTTQRAEGGLSAASGFETRDSTLRAYDKKTGKVVGEVALLRNATAAPMTYMMNGKQYIVVATGGSNMPAELIALSLP